MRPVALALLACLPLLAACRSKVPGELAAVSIRALEIPMTIVAQGAEGKACGNDTQQNIPAAIANALAQHPEANAFVNISLFKGPRCIRVSGTAVRVNRRGVE